MTTLFQDDFESGGLAAWTGINGTIGAAGAAAHGGAFGCEANSTDAFAYKDFSAPASQFVSHRADVKIVSASGGGQFRILQISQGTTQIALLFYDNGVYKLRLRNADNSIQETTVAGISAGSWQELRLDYDWSPGQAFYAKAYVDGTLKATLTDTTIAGGAIWQATRIFILTFEDSASGSGHLYFDNVIVADAAPAGGATYTESGGGSSAGTGSGADVLVLIDAGGGGGVWTGSGGDLLALLDSGGGSGIWVGSGGDVGIMIDAGGAIGIWTGSGAYFEQGALVYVAGRVVGPAVAGRVVAPAISGRLRES